MLNAVFQSTRPNFVILAPICTLLGIATAQHTHGDISIMNAVLLMLTASTAHISVNLLNEYQDFTSGLDLATLKTPFSGGSGSLPESPHAAKAVFSAARFFLVITISLGLYFVYLAGWPLLIAGMIGIGIISTYTQSINRQPWLCLITPGLAFGPIIVGASYYVLTGEFKLTALLISLIPFFLVNNLLLVNQYPDIKADKAHGRNHFPIHFGTTTSNKVYLLFVIAACACLMTAALLKLIPASSLFALVAAIPAFACYYGINHFHQNIAEHSQYMAFNVISALLMPLIISAVLLAR